MPYILTYVQLCILKKYINKHIYIYGASYPEDEFCHVVGKYNGKMLTPLNY